MLFFILRSGCECNPQTRGDHLILFNWEGQRGSEPANDCHDPSERKNEQRIENSDEPKASENIRDRHPPGKGGDLECEKQKRKSLLNVHWPIGFSHVVQPPCVKPCDYGHRSEEEASSQAVKGGRIKPLIAGEKIKNGKARGGDHEHNGEVNDHGVRMAPEHGEPRKEPGQRRRDLSFRSRFFLEDTHLRISIKYFQTVRGCLYIRCEVFARVVAFHVNAALPQFAGRHIDDLAPVSDIDRLSVLAVE